MSEKKIKIIIAITVIAIIIVLVNLISGLTSYAHEDIDNDERLNAIELRLIDYESTIEDIRANINYLIENDQLRYEQKLLMQQQLDVMILGLNEILNLYSDEIANNVLRNDIQKERYEMLIGGLITLISETQKTNKTLTETSEYLKSALDYMISLNVYNNDLIINLGYNLGAEIKESTEKTLQELNETLSITNRLLTYFYLIILGLFVVTLLIVVVKWVKDTLLKHI